MYLLSFLPILFLFLVQISSCLFYLVLYIHVLHYYFRVVKSFMSNNPDLLIQGYKLDLKQILQKALPAVILNFLFKRKVKSVGVAIGQFINEPTGAVTSWNHYFNTFSPKLFTINMGWFSNAVMEALFFFTNLPHQVFSYLKSFFSLYFSFFGLWAFLRW